MVTLSPEEERLANPLLDRITRLAAQFFSCPMSALSLIGRDRLLFPSRFGIVDDGAGRDPWFDTQSILSPEPLVIPDTMGDARFGGSVRFYASAPLIVRHSAMGTLAVMDRRPREDFGERELEALRDFAALAADALDRNGAAGQDRLGLAQALPAAVWMTDTAGHCTLLNRFEWDDAPAAHVRADLAFECRVPGPGGEDRWILEQARQRLQADGSFAGYIGLCLDITNRKRTEEALRETEEWLSLAQSAAGIGFWEWDLVRGASKFSDHCYRLYGLEPRTAVTYSDWVEWLHPDDRLSEDDLYRRAGLGGDELNREFRCIWPDGSVHWLYNRAKIYRDETGRAVRALGANIDISGFKEAEERRNQAERELISSREQLRQLAAHLEGAREQERIRIAREIHDELGQILTVLKMDLEAVDARYRTSTPRPLKDITRRVAAMLQNLDVMIGTVRRIASELRPGILDHLGIAAAIEWQLRETESRTGIRCRVAGLPEQLPLDGRRSTSVFRIFQEILTNVVRHAGAASIKVDMQADDASMILRVTDDGRGFDLSRLADPESLGLLGMRERALMLGGNVEIVSEPGKGTTVTLRIPFSAPASAVARAGEAAVPPAGESAAG
jgi:PAS domain S-box-containing protein